MNFDSIKGNWAELKGKFRAKWDRLTDEEIESFKTGDHQGFKERLREKYGYTKERADQEFTDFQSTLGEKKEQLSAKAGELKDRVADKVNSFRDEDPHQGDRLN